MIILRTLKKHGENKGRHFRAIPVPEEYLERLDEAHDIRDRQKFSRGLKEERLWTFSRTTAWSKVGHVMKEAGVTGARACARGLRHGFGVNAVITYVPENWIQKWLGHSNLSTTSIYMDLVGPEERAVAQRMWQ